MRVREQLREAILAVEQKRKVLGWESPVTRALFDKALAIALCDEKEAAK